MSASVSQQLSEVLLSALNQNLVQFTLRPGVQVTVYAAHLSAGKQTQPPVFTAAQEGLCTSVGSGTERKAWNYQETYMQWTVRYIFIIFAAPAD